MNKTILKNGIFKFILNFFNLVMPILIGPYLSRKFLPELMGEINYSQAIFGYFFIFASFGVYQYGLREISKVKNDKEKLSKVFTGLFTVTVLSNIITTVIFVIFIKLNFVAGTSKYIVLMILTFNFTSNVFYTEWVNEALEKFKFITIKTIIIKIMYIVCIFIMVKESSDYTTYVVLLGASTFLNNIVSFINIKRYVKFDFKNMEVKKHIKPMILVVILSNASVLYTSLDRVMLGGMGLDAQVGFYTMAQNISNIINTLMLTVIHVTIPRLAAFKKEEDGAYARLLNKVARVYFMLIFPTSIGLTLLSSEVIFLYGGEQYMPARYMMALFAIYIITLGYDAILSNQIMYIKRKEVQQVKMVFLGGVINLILNLIVVFTGNFIGEIAIITTMIANIVVIVIQHIYIKKKMNLDFNIFGMDKSKYFIYSLIFIPIIMLLRNFELPIIIFCGISVIVCSIAYGGILLISKDTIVKEFKDMILKR